MVLRRVAALLSHRETEEIDHECTQVGGKWGAPEYEAGFSTTSDTSWGDDLCMRLALVLPVTQAVVKAWVRGQLLPGGR